MRVSTVFEILVSVLAVVLLFLASTVFFDLVHWALHRMLTSRFGLLRVLAWPHAIHHRWIDRGLRVNWQYQRANVWCHLVLEYTTHLAFTGALLVVLPTGIAVGLASMQTAVFLLLLRDGGLDLNHRPQPVVEVAPSTVFCPIAYHAMHHAFPDAYFSSYVKLVDVVLGTALDLKSLRIGLAGRETAFARGLRAPLRAAGAVDIVELDSARGISCADVDVLVLCSFDADLASEVEAYLRSSGERQLPPEVWAVVDSPTDAVARHYFRDRRLLFRPILVPQGAGATDAVILRAARIAVAFVRRGAHLPRTSLVGFPARAFKRTRPQRPRGVPAVRLRAAEILAA